MLQLLWGGGVKKISPNFPFRYTLGKNSIQFDENINVKEPFEVKYSIKIGKVSAQTVHLFYDICTCRPDETVLTILE